MPLKVCPWRVIDMSLSSESFRSALRLFPSGVTVITIKVGEERHGLTVSAFTSVSPEPPLIAVCVDERNYGHQMMEREGAVFAVNILRESQEEISNRFAWVKDEDRFALGDWGVATTGAPILQDAAAWLDCTIHSRLKAGSHTIYVGEVQAAETPGEDDTPLIYWNRGYRKLHHK